MAKSDIPKRSYSAARKKSSSENEVESVNTIEHGNIASEIQSFTLRASRKIIEQVDEVVLRHPVIRNRNTWIVNAIVEQLKRERQG